MGGFTAYHLANSLGICALTYNPALPTVMMNKQFLQHAYKNKSFHTFVWVPKMISSKQRQLNLLSKIAIHKLIMISPSKAGTSNSH
jgi:hypothetical protein